MTSANSDSQTWHIYIIRTAHNTLYTGITTDLTRRFAEHQSSKKGAKALRGKGPLTLVWSQTAESKSAALKQEAAIKKLSKAKKEQLIRDTLTPPQAV